MEEFFTIIIYPLLCLAGFVLAIAMCWGTIASGYYAKKNRELLEKILQKLNAPPPGNASRQETDVICPMCNGWTKIPVNHRGAIRCTMCNKFFTVE